MRKILFLLIFGILLVGTISAYEFDNSVSYSNNDLTATIKNIWGLPLIGEDLGKLTLTSHERVDEIKYVMPNGYREVMTYKFSEWKENYPNGIESFKVYNAISKEVKNRDYYIKEIYYVDVPKYIQICEPIVNDKGNGRYCYQKESGTTKEKRYRDLNSKDIPTKDLEIAIFAYVKEGDYMDGVLKIAGTELKKHAFWQDSSLGLKQGWNFNTTITSQAIDIATGKHNLTNYASGITWDNSGCVIGSCSQFNGNSYYYNGTPSFNVNENNDFTILFWLNRTTHSANLGLYGIGNDHTYNGVGKHNYYYNQLNIGTNDGEIHLFASDTSVSSWTINDDVNVGLNADSKWHLVVYRRNVNNFSISIDGVTKYSNNGAITTALSIGSMQNVYGVDLDGTLPVGTGLLNNARMDEIFGWNRSLSKAEELDYYNSGAGTPFQTQVISPIVTLNNPVNSYNLTNSPTLVRFNCSAIDEKQISNITLIINGIENTTVSGTGTVYASLETFLNIYEGQTNWTCNSRDVDNQLGWATENRTINIHSFEPIIEIIYPQNNTDYKLNSIVETNFVQTTLNWTTTDEFLQSCFYYNGTGNTTLNCNTNTTSFNTTFGSHIFVLYANDSFGNNNSNSVNFSYTSTILLNSQQYNNVTTEGVSETFSINVTTDGSLITIARLNYNGTDYFGSITNPYDNVYLISNTIDIPNVNADSNISFFWNLTISSGVTYSSTPKIQLVKNIDIDDCFTYSTLLINYTLRDEKTQEIINSTNNNITIETDLQIYPIKSNILLLNFSGFNNTNNFKICLNTNFTNSSQYRLYSETRYSLSNYVPEYHFLQNFTISNATTPQNINLYDLKLAESTEFTMVYKGNTFLAVPNAIIILNRKYVSEGVFKEVEMAMTDNSGQGVAHFDTTYQYTITVFKEGSLLSTFDNVAIFCDNKVTLQCNLQLYASSTSTSPDNFYTANNLYYTASLNDTTRTFTTFFQTLDSSTSIVSLNITRFDGLTNTTICSNQLQSSSGSLICSIPQSYGNTTFIVKIFKDGNLINSGIFSIRQQAREIFKDNSLILILGLLLTIPMMFIPSVIGVILGIFLGLILSIAIFFLNGELIGGTSFLVWFTIVAIILIWKIQQRGSD